MLAMVKKIQMQWKMHFFVPKQAKTDSDSKVAVRKLFLKNVGERDIGIQEVMHQFTSLKLLLLCYL